MNTYLLLFALLGTCYAQQPLTAEQQELLDRNRRSDINPNVFVNVDKQALPTNMNDFKTKIKYPKEALQKGIEGKVLIRVLVDTTGIPIDTTLIRSADQLFTEEVMKHIYSLRFEPATLYGKPIFFWSTVPLDFSLKKNPLAQPQKP
jgi:TonB family protein